MPKLAKAHNRWVNEAVSDRLKGREWHPDELEDSEIMKGDYFDSMVQTYHGLCSNLMGRDRGGTSGLSDSTRSLRLGRFLDFHIFSYLKFFDHTLPDEHPDNYYFEREWRVLGWMGFSVKDIRRVLIPEAYAKRFRDDCPEYYGRLTFAEYG